MSAPEIIQQKPSGCLRRLLLLVVVPIFALILVLAGGSLWILDKFDPHLSRTPYKIPDAAVSALEFQVLRGRIDSFKRAQAEGLPAEVRLTDREIGGLIAKHEDWSWGRGVSYFRIEGQRLLFFLSLPVSKIPVLGIFGGGKHLNMIFDISPRVLKGKFDPDIRQVWIGDRAASPEELAAIRKFVDRALTDPYPFTREIIRGGLRNLSECFISEGNLVLRCGGFGRVYEPPPAEVVTPPLPQSRENRSSSDTLDPNLDRGNTAP